MRPIIILALSAVLTITFASCRNPQASKQTDVQIEQNTTDEIKKNSDTIIILYKELEPVKRSIAQKVYNIPKYKSVNWDTHKIENIQCIQDQWMRVPRKLMQDSLIVRLVDAYNACVVWHSVGCDMEVFWRWDCYTDSAMLSMDLSIFNDDLARDKAQQLIEKSAAGQRDSTIDVVSPMNDYVSWLSDYFNISNFFNTDTITDEVYWAATDKANWIENYASMEDKRGQSDSIYQQQLLTMLDTATDFNVYCILAIEYAHSSIDGPHMTEALPYLVKTLTAGIYSPMLREAWRTWRAIMTSEMGQSKDSDIPNAEYNQLRMISCYTMLCYIHDNPKDWLAVNNYLVTAYQDNICRYGTYMFGNQGMMDRIEMFPEWTKRVLDK